MMWTLSRVYLPTMYLLRTSENALGLHQKSSNFPTLVPANPYIPVTIFTFSIFTFSIFSSKFKAPKHSFKS